MKHLLYNVEDRPPLLTSVLLAAQHLLAALGGIIAVPLVVGDVLKLPTDQVMALVNAALLVSGVVTIIQCRGLGIIGIRLPCVMGTSFTFVTAAIAIGQEHGVAGILGSSLLGSFVMIIGSFFMPQIRRLFPPVVTGVVVMMIGLSLMPVAIDWFAGAMVGSKNYAEPVNLSIALFVLIFVITLVQWGKGIASASAIVIGMAAGYILSLALGLVDFSAVKEAQLLAVPKPFYFGMTFPISGIIGMSIAYLVTIVESTGNFLALGSATKTPMSGQKMTGGILCDGVGSALAAIMSTTPFSSFAQNIGVVSLTGVASRHVVAITGILLVLAGLFPIFGAIIVTIPLPVLGGAGLMMFAMIITAGIQMLGQVKHDKRNGLIISVAIGCSLAVTMRPELLSKLPEFLREIFSSGITIGTLAALLLNLILPGREHEISHAKEAIVA